MSTTPDRSVENASVLPVFSDERGDIYDIVEEPMGHIGLITFKKGAIRGRHYHNVSVQCSYILRGTILLKTSDQDGNNAQEFTLTEGMLSRIPPHTIHTYEALTDAAMIDMNSLSRTDDGYEQDTVRV